MNYINLQLASTLDQDGVGRVLNALLAVPGVDEVDAQVATSVVGISFDQDRTSAQELGSVLARSGHPAKQGHANGGCCGSCGG